MTLDFQQQAILASYVSTDGFKIVCGLLKDEVLEFNKILLTKEKPEDVVLAHTRASVAAKIYEGFLSRIDAEVYMYTATPRKDDKPQDVTEGTLDIGTEEYGTTD